MALNIEKLHEVVHSRLQSAFRISDSQQPINISSEVRDVALTHLLESGEDYIELANDEFGEDYDNTQDAFDALREYCVAQAELVIVGLFLQGSDY